MVNRIEYFISNHGPLRALNRLHMNYLITQKHKLTPTHTLTPTKKKTTYINKDQDSIKVDKNTNNKNPDNYRGIAITSNTGKLFNMILNVRLGTFWEENQIIDGVQIGFTKNARSSDHMIVMKSLIDKYINVNGGKLYSCFVDFRKAFDSVIHPGLKLKLKELNINGKFYDILSSLYPRM